MQDYEKFINFANKKSFEEKLRLVNDYINGFNGIFDSNIDPNIDSWSTRGEFLQKGGGDCEDYAIAKYYTLKDLGIDEKNMCLLLVKEKYSKSDHMVLAFWENHQKIPLILDNLSIKVLPLDKRIDLKASICMNAFGYFSIDKFANKNKIQVKLIEYENMLNRQKKEKIWKK